MPQAQVIRALIRPQGRQPRIDLKLADRVNDALLHAERCLDDAFIATAELTVLLPSVRSQTNIAFNVPQDAIAAGTAVISTLTQARADLQTMHRELAVLRDRLRVPVRMDGPLWKPGEGPDGGSNGDGG